MPRRAAKGKISYFEESDEDDAPAASVAGESSDEGDETSSAASSSAKGKGGRRSGSKRKQTADDTSSTAHPAKKRKGKGKALPSLTDGDKGQTKGVFSLELLLKLPFDLIAEASLAHSLPLDEVCSFLSGGDLVQLARTCKSVRELLLDPQSNSIWVASRLRRELPLPEGMTEQQFADFIDGNTCQVCSTEWKGSKVIKGSKIRNGMKGLHPLTRQCVRFHDHGISPWSDRQQPIEYLVRDLWNVSNKLFELAEEDEIAKHMLNASRSNRTTRSRRVKAAPEDIPAADHVEKYVAERKAWVLREQGVSKRIDDTIQSERDAARKIIEEAQKRKDDERQAKLEDLHHTLKFEHDWSRQQLDWHGARSAHFRIPAVSPQANPKAWATFRDFVQSEIDREAAEDAARNACETRRNALKPYYDDFKEAQTGRMARLVPDIFIFVEWPAVKPFWEPVDSSVSDRTWAQNLSRVRDNFDTYLEEVRVEAIRAIKRATTGDWSSASSTDPADYPEDEYDDAWFERPTALFFGELAVSNQPGFVSLYPLPYPDTLFEHRMAGDRKAWLREHIDERQVRLVRLILGALDKNEDNVTQREMNLVGARFRWVNSPYKVKKERERRYNWVQLFYALKRRGPKIYELTSGMNLPEIALWPAEEGEYDFEEDYYYSE
ncbi:hypothetical protein JCM10449v2_006720 [Rhodotorula kratochvilovae]